MEASGRVGSAMDGARVGAGQAGRGSVDLGREVMGIAEDVRARAPAIFNFDEYGGADVGADGSDAGEEALFQDQVGEGELKLIDDIFEMPADGHPPPRGRAFCKI